MHHSLLSPETEGFTHFTCIKSECPLKPEWGFARVSNEWCIRNKDLVVGQLSEVAGTLLILAKGYSGEQRYQRYEFEKKLIESQFYVMGGVTTFVTLGIVCYHYRSGR